MSFHVGQKVVCVSGPLIKVLDGRPLPTVGDVYTIRAIKRGFHRDFGRSVLLNEIVSPTHPEDGQELGFFAIRFRPVIERKTDISIFTAMLKPSKVEA